ncbi:MAG TPA: hypothetical protein VFK35_03125 [Candidatus Limnocylindrales bacterium]|nr:hypothetical protein [Candidatus Limnocylindrales bacterium]
MDGQPRIAGPDRFAAGPDQGSGTERGRGEDRRSGEPISHVAPPPPDPGSDEVPGPALGIAPPLGRASGPPSPPPNGTQAGPIGERSDAAACTAPQLRRFIKSRPYVPMHELRRRFGINGADDDVTAVGLSSGTIYVGLPLREGALLGELLRGGDIGYELSLDPRSPIVIGLYPMRPVARS